MAAEIAAKLELKWWPVKIAPWNVCAFSCGRIAAISWSVTLIPRELLVSASACTFGPVRVVVDPMSATTTSWLISGQPPQFIVI